MRGLCEDSVIMTKCSVRALTMTVRGRPRVGRPQRGPGRPGPGRPIPGWARVTRRTSWTAGAYYASDETGAWPPKFSVGNRVDNVICKNTKPKSMLTNS